MNIFHFTDDLDYDKEYKYNILVYPNITFMRDLEKDSYVVVLRNVIKELNKTSWGKYIHWTILSPYEVKSLIFENTEQLPIELPSYPNAMRTHFNHKQLLKTIDWKKNDYDVVYTHLPEHTLQLSNMFVNETNISPKFIGYCHWYEVPENTAYAKTMLMSNIAGTLEMDECGVNTKWLKDLIIEKSKLVYKKNITDRLEKIIQPHYLGVDDISTGHKHKPKTILFNHRDNEYTGYTWFVKRMDELWEKRQDFKVYTTLTDLDRPYAERVKLHSRDDYLNFVRSMHMGVGCFQKYSAWSISTTDGLSQGVPYILPNGMCYPEMVGEQYPLLYNGANEFKSVMSQVPTALQLIPAVLKETENIDDAFYEYEPDETEILAELLPRAMSTQIFTALLENGASEQGARMSAMDSATRNAGDMIDKLTIEYNRSRQAVITNELIEIISGAEAL